MVQQKEGRAIPPERGALVYDRESGKVGEFQGMGGPYFMLRPVGGGREWQADPRLTREPTRDERLSAGIKAANSRSAIPPLDPLEHSAGDETTTTHQQ
jgi:hypothetical protein